jgi:hypothetical protein
MERLGHRRPYPVSRPFEGGETSPKLFKSGKALKSYVIVSKPSKMVGSAGFEKYGNGQA